MDEAIKAKQVDGRAIRNLLQRWAELEPGKFNTDTLVLINDPAVETEPVYLMRIQWAVQQAIVERNLSLDIHYGATGWNVFVDGYNGYVKGKENVAEALLEAYVDALE